MIEEIRRISKWPWAMLMIVILVLSSFRNSSKDVEFLLLEQISEDEQITLNQLHHETLRSKVDSFMRISNKRYRFNGTVLLASNGNILFEGAYGYQNLISKDTLNASSSFQLASVSKQFTAVATLMLKERGLLKLEDKVTSYLPEFPYERITIEMLLQHTSGLPNYMWMLEHHWPDSTIPNNSDLLGLMAELNLPLYFTPGRRHDYSNTGYVMLASLIEKVSEKSYKDFIEQEIFRPLEMNNSFVFVNGQNTDSFRTVGYLKKWRGWREYDATVHDGLVGDKGIYSSVQDLYLWDQSLYHHSLLSEHSLEAAFTKGKIRKRWEFAYGYGFRIKSRDDKKIVYHHGRWEGFRNSFVRMIEDELTVVALSNSDCRSISTISYKLEKMLAASKHQPEIELVNTAINYGLGFGIEKHALMIEDNPQLVINPAKLDSSISYLEAIEKHQLAEIIRQLRSSITVQKAA